MLLFKVTAPETTKRYLPESDNRKWKIALAEAISLKLRFDMQPL
jgi:hypothetical protein